MSLHAAALDTLARFEALGVAVFPGYYGKKGTFIRGWSTMPAPEAWRRTREEIQTRGVVNLAARTGESTDGTYYCVVDCDAGRFEARRHLLRLAYGDAIAFIVRTHRGAHIWLRLPEPVRNGMSEAVQILCVNEKGRGHLANLPPSRHPAGTSYRWETVP